MASTVCLGDSWVPYGVLIWGMRVVGKAPWVNILPRAELLGAMEKAGFVGIEQPEVGIDDGIGVFTVARKPR